ncbi:DNA cytosine methyltransferase [Pectobacterium carotovorum]|uniref:DNA cytosine methyltransferase n=1 Tax=Pectobacterium carotovorum TaxID=554 RepID=UPI000D73C052|nr:DNA cytosine methyltransferase [Pectobacterium carotovorum]PXB01140.1 DNA cytosine methyltransferase [Pectobacterium carotovorum subsp. carotovorum]
MNELALFAGAGGGILAGHLLGWRTVCAVERDAYASQVLAQRQNDGILRPFPIWSDVRSFDGKPWRGIVDVVSGGFPCQDISSAGRGAGIDGEKSGLWREMARIIDEVRPEYVFVENSPLLIGRGLARVISDLAEIGFDCQWGRVSAKECGAPHKRDRLWMVGRNVRYTAGEGLPIRFAGQMERPTSLTESKRSGWWSAEPRVPGVANGLAHRVDRIKALGNGQVPRVAAAAFSIFSDRE